MTTLETYKGSTIKLCDRELGDAKERWFGGRYLVFDVDSDGKERGFCGEEVEPLVRAVKKYIDDRRSLPLQRRQPAFDPNRYLADQIEDWKSQGFSPEEIRATVLERQHPCDPFPRLAPDE